jgi:hypothetical protein
MSAVEEPEGIPIGCDTEQGREGYLAGWSVGSFQLDQAFNAFGGCDKWQDFEDIVVNNILLNQPKPPNSPYGLCRFSGTFDAMTTKLKKLRACCDVELACCDGGTMDGSIGSRFFCLVMVATEGTVDPADYSLPPSSRCGFRSSPCCFWGYLSEVKADAECQAYSQGEFVAPLFEHMGAVCGAVRCLRRCLRRCL